MAGAQRVGLQRGQDAHRPPRRGPGLPGVQRPPLPRQAADQTVQGGLEATPATANRRNEGPARGQRAGGDQTTEPDYPGMVGLLPDGVSGRVFTELDKHVWTLTYKWASPPTRTSRGIGLFTVTSASSTAPGVIGGFSVTVIAAPTYTSSPGQRSSATRWCQAGRPRTTRPWPSSGPGGDGEATPRLTAQPAAAPGAARALPGLRRASAARRPRAADPDEWEQWLSAPARRSATKRSPPNGHLASRTGHRHPSHPRPLPTPPARRCRRGPALVQS